MGNEYILHREKIKEIKWFLYKKAELYQEMTMRSLNLMKRTKYTPHWYRAFEIMKSSHINYSLTIEAVDALD
jgi:hypothetical protein